MAIRKIHSSWECSQSDLEREEYFNNYFKLHLIDCLEGENSAKLSLGIVRRKEKALVNDRLIYNLYGNAIDVIKHKIMNIK